ncbi:MAG: hypothetical protein FWG88_11810 [Oscillospiraceae bacterium]|nr:hypothetical protein [Oscillospiraceae bacterium]
MSNSGELIAVKNTSGRVAILAYPSGQILAVSDMCKREGYHSICFSPDDTYILDFDWNGRIMKLTVPDPNSTDDIPISMQCEVLHDSMESMYQYNGESTGLLPYIGFDSKKNELYVIGAGYIYTSPLDNINFTIITEFGSLYPRQIIIGNKHNIIHTNNKFIIYDKNWSVIKSYLHNDMFSKIDTLPSSNTTNNTNVFSIIEENKNIVSDISISDSGDLLCVNTISGNAYIFDISDEEPILIMSEPNVFPHSTPRFINNDTMIVFGRQSGTFVMNIANNNQAKHLERVENNHAYSNSNLNDEESSKTIYDFLPQTHRDFYMSEEYAQVKASYDDKCARIIEKIKEYPQNVDDLLSSVLENTARKEYSVGSEGLILGYYHPSPIHDLIVSGVNRGRLLKKPTTKYSLTHQYHFDSRNKLILSAPLLSNILDSFNDMQNELCFVFNDSDTRIVLCFQGTGTINNALYCIYDEGNIVEYNCISFIDFSEDSNTYATLLECEEYSYGDGQLTVANTYTFFPDKLEIATNHVASISNTSTLLCKRYEFEHDEKGYLQSYKYSEFLGNTPITLDSYSHRITKKRKI